MATLPKPDPPWGGTSLRSGGVAYQLSKWGNSLRVMAEAVRWGKRGVRVNTISPGIIITPLAKDELTGPRCEGYRRTELIFDAIRTLHLRGIPRNDRRPRHGLAQFRRLLSLFF
jgi:NAD(P)-dependent dehydrogenase (short-subunit alcohol dehydrogenase family)